MTGWEPATEAEAAMRDALRSGDQEQYFRVLGRVELLLPVSSDALAGRAPMGWGTWTTGGRTHVLAFTSPEALRVCLADHAGSARRLPYHELAAAWPNLEWWLAVNPGLPIEGYLPAWFVAQLARGDVRLPGRARGGPPHPATDEQAALVAPSGASGPGRPPELGVGPAGREDAWIAAEAAHDWHADPLSRRSAPLSPAGTAPRGPAGSAGPVARPPVGGPPGQPYPPSQSSPGWPAGRGSDPAGPEADGEGRTPGADWPAGSHSDDWISGPGDASEARERTPWPAEQGDAAEASPAGVEADDPDAVAERSAGRTFVPANHVEEDLIAAVEAGSTDRFLSTLLLARVLLPVGEDAPAETLPGDEKFSWRTETIDGGPYVVVYTSPERLAEHAAEGLPTVGAKFIQLIHAWPDEAWSFAVNPGTPVGATLPGAQIIALANWADEVGLGEDAGEPAIPAAQEDPSAEAGASAAAGPARDALQPIIMQKAIAPAQLAYYLDRGYDRVSGFVHRANELSHQTTPAGLVAALGLAYPGSPFAADAAEVHVLRWPAYRPSLYRIPYGGPSDSAMRAMEGWVIERPPFRGNGFAPGETDDIIAEFKVDSVRLPHGAELWRLAADGTQTRIAVFDADESGWQREGEPEAVAAAEAAEAGAAAEPEAVVEPGPAAGPEAVVEPEVDEPEPEVDEPEPEVAGEAEVAGAAGAAVEPEAGSAAADVTTVRPGPPPVSARDPQAAAGDPDPGEPPA